MSLLRTLRLVLPLAAVLAALPAAPIPARAQASSDWDAARVKATRESLEELLARYEGAAESGAYSAQMRARARYEAALIRQRLEEGDFQVGDRIALTVENQEALADTFVVATGKVLKLPIVGDVPLDGVLRSELEAHLTAEIGRYLKDPVVRAQSLIRIAIMGSVGRQGYYTVPAEAVLTDVLMVAGGPAANAKLTEIRIERGDDRIWGGEPLQEAIVQGRTLDQLSIRAGDRIVVPGEERRSWFEIARIAVFVIPSILALFQAF